MNSLISLGLVYQDSEGLIEISASSFNLKMKEQLTGGPSSIYTTAPELVDPNISLKASLKQIFDEGTSKNRILQKKVFEKGLNGRVKFVQFLGDPNPDRWFAIKRPLYRDVSQVGSYFLNAQASIKIGEHPNFMKVCGVIVKNTQKPYLILDYIDGVPLKDIDSNSLSMHVKVDLLRQLKGAILHLYDQPIHPGDLHVKNILITKDNKLKFIDFDEWVQLKRRDENFAKKLFQSAQMVHQMLIPGNIIVNNISSRDDLEFNLNRLIESSALSISSIP